MSETLADVGEFGLIRRLRGLIEAEGVSAPGTSLGIGDDTASFQPRPGHELLVTCDCMVEGQHFLPGRMTPSDIGRRAMVANVSDIGAMGGRPLYAVVSLGLQASTPVADVESVYRGFLDVLNPLGASIIGGNVAEAAHAAFIDVTLLGEVEQGRAVRRSTARPGDAILVTGCPGQSAAGLRLLLEPERSVGVHVGALIDAYRAPTHRAREGQAIAGTGRARAMIDTSDGFLGDLGHICEDSSTGALLKGERLALDENLKRGAADLGTDALELFLGASDDYELIVACRPDDVKRIHSAVRAVSAVPVTEVGILTEAPGVLELALPNGGRRRLHPAGWDHFGSGRGSTG